MASVKISSFQQLVILVMVFGVVGCGSGDKDPLKDYEVVNSAVMPHTDPMKPQYEMQSLYQVDALDNLTFVQGVEKSVRFDLRLNVDAASRPKYSLVAIDAPKGSQFTKDPVTGQYVFTWKPNAGLLNAQETFKAYSFGLQLSPTQVNDIPYRVNVIVQKDLSQPSILDKKTYSPEQVIDSGQGGKVRFQVEARGLQASQNLEIRLLRGPELPSRELVQMDGAGAVLDRPRLVDSQFDSTKEALRNTYEIIFDTERFLDQLLQKIEKDPVLKKRFQSGTLDQVEALFYVQAINVYNGRASAEHTIVFKINITPKAAEPVLLGPESTSLPAGGYTKLNFQIKSKGGKGEVNAQLDSTENELVTSNLSCRQATSLHANEIGCASTSCILNCTLEVESACNAKPQTLSHKINTTSVLGSSSEEKVFTINVQITKALDSCQGATAREGAQ